MSKITEHIDVSILDKDENTRDTNVLIAISNLLDHTQIQINATDLWALTTYMMSIAVRLFGPRVSKGNPQWPKCPNCATKLTANSVEHNYYCENCTMMDNRA